MSEWISVEERLPESTSPYIVYGGGPVWMAWYLPRECRWEGLHREPIQGITHWMPLPLPPQEVDDRAKTADS